MIKCEERYNKAKAVHSVLRHVADQHGLWLEDLYKQVGWPLYRKHGHAFDAFSKYLLPEGDERYEDVFAELGLSPELKDSIVTYIKRYVEERRQFIHPPTYLPIKSPPSIALHCFSAHT